MPREPLVVTIIFIVIIVIMSDNISFDNRYRIPNDMRSARPSLGRWSAPID